MSQESPSHSPPGARVDVLSAAAGYTVIRLARPAQRNALDLATLQALSQAIVQARDSDAAVLVITGSGGHFCAGGDLKELAGASAAYQDTVTRQGQTTFDLLESADMLTIAVIEGYCIGGGLELAMACDLRVATVGAEFRLPEVALGGLPCWGGTQRLTRMVGLGRAKEMLLVGSTCTADQAERWGLINAVTGDLDGAWRYVDEVDRVVTQSHSESLGVNKRLLQDGYDLSLAEGLAAEAEADRRIGAEVGSRWVDGRARR